MCFHIFKDMASRQGRHTSVPSELYFSLQSRIWPILEDSDVGVTENDRWQSNANRIALEIARAISALHGCSNNSNNNNPDRTILFIVEKTLASYFAPKSNQFQYFQDFIQKRLEAATFVFARRYLHMTPLEICESQCTRQLQNHVSEPHYADLERIAKRLAHIGVLHWKVWAPLLYARQEAVITPANAGFDSELNDSREDAARLQFG
jgi:hypothetical protein